MFHKQLHIVGGFLIILAVLSACSILGEKTPAAAPGDTLIFTQAAQTVVAQLTPPPATQTAMATKPRPTLTPFLAPTDTPLPAVEPSATAALPTFQPPALVRANLNTYCRAGPGVSYDIVGMLVPGDDVSLQGKSDPAGWWYIRNPPQHRQQPIDFCWVWSGSTRTSGDLETVPVVSPPG